jgi:hypothetical protein
MNALALHPTKSVDKDGRYPSQRTIINSVDYHSTRNDELKLNDENHTDDRTPDLLLKEPYYR